MAVDPEEAAATFERRAGKRAQIPARIALDDYLLQAHRLRRLFGDTDLDVAGIAERHQQRVRAGGLQGRSD
jgi:hypothetical protein